MAAIEVRDVYKEYQRDSQRIPVLSGLTLEVAEGDYVALMGPSGSGKTTLLNLVGGSSWWASATGSATTRASSRAGRSSASRSRARW